jgi:hypothetical protein
VNEQYRQWDNQNSKATPVACDLCPLRTVCKDLLVGSDECVIVWRLVRANLKVAKRASVKEK